MLTNLLNWLKSLFVEKPKKLVTVVRDAVIEPPSRNMKFLKMAASQIGVKEVSGPKSNPVVEEYLDWGYSKKNVSTSLTDDVPWCAGFICWCLEKVGMGSTDSLMARSFERWGLSSIDDPLPGDIITFWRNSKSSGSGHVGIFLGRVGSRRAFVLGGNQSDSVCISTYSLNRLTDIRRSSKQYALSKAQRSELKKMADKILKDNGIIPPGSVV